jgi:Toprim-like
MRQALSLADLESNDPRAPRGGKERRFLCPLCGKDKPRDSAHRSLSLNTSTGAWVCHRCGEKGLLKEHWTGAKPLNRRARTRAALGRAFAISPSSDKAERRTASDDQRWREAWDASRPLEMTAGAAYLEGRGVPADAAAEADVRFSPAWYGRAAVLFPILDRAGALVAVNGRFVDGRDNPKTQSGGPKSLGVFATPGALSAPLIAVCEAPIDALSLWLCGIAAVALNGTSWPEWLPSALAFKPVLLATDADIQGDAAAKHLSEELSARGARPCRLRSRGAKDWNGVLDLRGVEALRSHLSAFSEAADDEARVNAAYALLRSGRAELAWFLVSLLEDVQTRELVRARLRQKEDEMKQYVSDVRVGGVVGL